jgi:hypothetical protein
MYYEGSHRLPEYRFSGGSKHWSPERGSYQHDQWAADINTNAKALGMPRRTFLPRNGDARHYCPSGVEPNFFGYRPDGKGVQPYANEFYCSEYFDVTAPT